MLGIDVGLTNIQVVGIKNGKITFKDTKIRSDRFDLDRYLENFQNLSIVYYTGNKNYYKPNHGNLKIHKKNEINSLGIGAIKLAGLKKAIVVGCGTGTCVVDVKRNCTHYTGSSIGGGTLIGLCELFLKTNNIQRIVELSKNGDLSRLDYMLKDISDTPIGFLDVNSTITHFGRIKKATNADAALGFMNMIGQNIGTLAATAAKGAGQKNILLVGKLLDIVQMRKIIKDRISLINPKANVIIPNNYEFATALGSIF